MKKEKINKLKANGRIDIYFLLIVVLLGIFGTIMVFSAGSPYAKARYDDEYYFIKRQVIWLLAGIFIMILSSKINLELIRKYTPLSYGITLGLLLLVLIVGFVGNGAKRWIAIGPITIQPSEIAKLTMILMLSYYFASKEDIALSKSPRKAFIYGTMFPLLIMVIPIFLVMLQKHLSCIIILGTIGICLIIASGVHLRYIYIFSAIGISGVSALALFTDYTKERITVWQNPEKYKLTGGWQTLQGLMAIGSGGIFGVGYGKSVMKHCYVSEPANDMIFAILCEELGLIGAIFALSLFLLLVTRGTAIALKAENSYERLVAFGICAKMAIQVLLNVAVVTNSIPNTGISLPFFSYGGSSLIMIFFEMGILLSISRNAKIQK